MKRRFALKTAVAAAVATAATAALFTAPAFAQTGGTIKVDVLHSLSGTMAISETVLKDVALMAFDEIISCLAFSATSGQLEAGSTTTASIFLPSTPPLALANLRFMCLAPVWPRGRADE